MSATDTHTYQLIRTQIMSAISTANISIRLGQLAIVCFCVFGTLASMAVFRESAAVYYAFHYLPYALIGVTIPLSLHHAFLLLRYRIMAASILLLFLAVGTGLLLFVLGRLMTHGMDVGFFMGLFLAMMAWVSMPYVFRVNLRKFSSFLDEKLAEKPAEN